MFRTCRALPGVIAAGQRVWRWPAGRASGRRPRCRVRRFRGGFRDPGAESILMTPSDSGGPAVAVRVSVTVTQVNDDGSESPADGELAAALAGPVARFPAMAAWAADDAAGLDHGDREKELAEPGRDLQRQLLEATFAIDSAREERIVQVTSAAGIRHGTVEKGHDRGVASIFGPVRAVRLAYRNRREPNLCPADARWGLADDPYSMGMRALVAYHLAGGGYGQAQEIIEARTGVTAGRAQLNGLASDLAAWADDFYEQRSRDASDAPPGGDVLMMQADGKGIVLRPEHRKNAGKGGAAHPGIKKMAEIVAVAGFTPAVREPEDIAAPPARRKAHPGPQARDKWVSASITEDIPAMIGAAFDEADRRDPQRARQRVFLVDGNRQQITAITGHARQRRLKVPVLIDFIHVPGYLGKPPPRCTPATRRRPRSGPTGRNSAFSTDARRPPPPPSPPSPPKPAPIPGPATSTWPTWTRPSRTSRTTRCTCATTRRWPAAGRSRPA